MDMENYVQISFFPPDCGLFPQRKQNNQGRTVNDRADEKTSGSAKYFNRNDQFTIATTEATHL